MIETLAMLAGHAVDRLSEYGVTDDYGAAWQTFTMVYAAPAPGTFDPSAGATTPAKARALVDAAMATRRDTEGIAAMVDPSPLVAPFPAPVSTGDVDAVSVPLSARVARAATWSARTHDTTVRRGKKGSVVKVTRRGRAYVHGSVDDIPTLLAVCGDRLAGGWDTLAVSRATAALYRDDVPRMLGTDAMAWSEIVPADVSTLDVHGVAVHSAGLAGYLPAGIDRELLTATVTGARERPVTPYAARLSLRRPARRSGDPTGTDTALVAPHSDTERIWVGHTLVTRAPVKARGAVRAARTVGAFRVASLPDALAAMRTMELPERGRVTFTGADFTATLTRGARARSWSGRITRDGADPITAKGSVSGAAIADRLARVTA